MKPYVKGALEGGVTKSRMKIPDGGGNDNRKAEVIEVL